MTMNYWRNEAARSIYGDNSEAARAADETTVTARDLGRAYALCMPYICEDRAWKRAQGRNEINATHEAEFRAGFRSAD